mmetsp:Transcript_38475/g.93081  ORF Transcript_38475/g.93081 Transcript_38475/m.93081 type:complete len:373 (-) Transcript_38475:105-1223(-)|eukprot:CAMPEP_0113640996 /NCGR_PEP_ID=MMETSP0017_2-20120614/21522_1 /TAXON_ID=2856 /ORGANISM="Cylindrotheca closterium" /LENGTH=372 /DNA_ID=CAMNT_0000552317 /DNA_START=242 /DNA_END=1360 /DNA_ORIENTATION=- /assembly_acc=CAM_ASM_000147
MSATPSAMMNTSKKAVHVKWAGKTIALGTFPSAEADEKCARAKALTRAWRSTMRPKPTRDWVMLELERLGVRVVSGRLGRKAGDDDDADKKNGALGLDTGIDPTMPPHRPLVGGGAAAAYEAARADHYQQKREEQQRRASSLGLGMGGGMGGGGMPQMGLSVNPNQHYEMLKLHHMNLLNEIQETTLMMNLYQQQQLQQQQQQLQQQQVTADVSGGNDQMSMLLQQQQGSSGAGAGGMDFNTRGSLGLGTLGAPSSGITSSSQASGGDQLSMMRQPQSIPSTAATPAPTPGSANGGAGPGADIKNELMKGQQEQAELEAKLQKLRDDIAKRKKEADELEASASGDKKRENEESEDPSAKRQKTEDDVAAKIM